mgnify:CR=1 FL=1
MQNPSQTNASLTDEHWEEYRNDLRDRLKAGCDSWKSRIYKEGFEAGVARNSGGAEHPTW